MLYQVDAGKPHDRPDSGPVVAPVIRGRALFAHRFGVMAAPEAQWSVVSITASPHQALRFTDHDFVLKNELFLVSLLPPLSSFRLW